MTAQTEYNKKLPVALAGQLYDVGNSDIDSFAAEAIIPFGVFVGRGATADQVLVAQSPALGVSVRTAKENPFPASVYNGGQYEISETVGVLRSGYIWAQFDAIGGTLDSEVTITAGGLVVAAGGGAALTGIKATIEKPAVDVVVGGDGLTGVFVGLVKVFAA